MPTNAYNIVLVQPRGYLPALALWDVCRLLQFSMESLGLPAALRVNQLDVAAVNIVVGYHLASSPAEFGDCRVIFYQLEQLSDREGWFTPQRLEVLRRGQEVWDYSPQNVAFLRAKGLGNVKLLPLGYHDKLGCIREAPKEFDVLFYGSLNDRRKRLLERLAAICRVHALVGVYGEKRDAFIARSKIILNLHFYEAQILEQARLSYLINNGCFVVSENSPHNPYDGMFVAAAYDDLPAVCQRYLGDEPERRRIANEGLERFRRQPMAEYLRAVISGAGENIGGDRAQF